LNRACISFYSEVNVLDDETSEDKQPLLMTGTQQHTTNIHQYFVDEAGDAVLFGARGQARIGTEGCSRYFMLGVAHIAEPVGLGKSLHELRAKLLADPFFVNVPSFDPQRKKTALFFHAKNDLPEVRERVFRLLEGFEIRVHAVIRDKRSLLEEVKKLSQTETSYRYNENDIYDDCTSLLFQDLLYRGDSNTIIFARRGKDKRIAALGDALDHARLRYENAGGEVAIGPTTADAAYPDESAGLQAIDYCLWALQRKYERGEERFYKFLESKFEAVIELDTTGKNEKTP
jgi:hypothetical protein